MKMKAIVDDLSCAGAMVKNDDLILYILSCLGSEYIDPTTG